MPELRQKESASRNLSAAPQWLAVFQTDLSGLIGERRTLWLGLVQLLPIVAALLLVFWAGLDPLSVYSTLVEQVVFPFFVPLMAIFFGAPVLVDEIERQTLTYLTLRPISKPLLYVGKWAAGATIAEGLVLVPLTAMVGIYLAGGGALGGSGLDLGRTFLSALLGTAAYAGIFAALGALFARSIIASVLYYIFFDLVMGAIPVLKLATIQYHVSNIAGLSTGPEGGMAGMLLGGGSISVSWWVSALLLAMFVAGTVAVGSLIFGNRQYYM
jgi:hypothetical protein